MRIVPLSKLPQGYCRTELEEYHPDYVAEWLFDDHDGYPGRQDLILGTIPQRECSGTTKTLQGPLKVCAEDDMLAAWISYLVLQPPVGNQRHMIFLRSRPEIALRKLG